jgi:hypothetical protein
VVTDMGMEGSEDSISFSYHELFCYFIISFLYYFIILVKDEKIMNILRIRKKTTFRIDYFYPAQVNALSFLFVVSAAVAAPTADSQ